MSEVKRELCVVYPATLGYETDYRPATTAEIMASHPKCGECRHYETDGFHIPFCASRTSPSRTMEIHPTADYCRHWEGKE